MEILRRVSVEGVKLVAGHGSQNSPLWHQHGAAEEDPDAQLGTSPIIPHPHTATQNADTPREAKNANLELPPGVELPQLLHSFRQVDFVGITVSLLPDQTERRREDED